MRWSDSSPRTWSGSTPRSCRGRVGSYHDPGSRQPPDLVGRQAAPMLTLAMASPAIPATAISSSPPPSSSCTPRRCCMTTWSTRANCGAASCRRGCCGNEASVLVGDFLLGQAFRMMVEVGSLRALDILSSAAATIAEGEVMQLAAAKNTATTEDENCRNPGQDRRIVAAACEVGPVIANWPKAEKTACRSVGMDSSVSHSSWSTTCGLRRQGRQLGRNIGDDFREGKITLPVVLAFRAGTTSNANPGQGAGARRDRRRPRPRDRPDEQDRALEDDQPRRG